LKIPLTASERLATFAIVARLHPVAAWIWDHDEPPRKHRSDAIVARGVFLPALVQTICSGSRLALHLPTTAVFVILPRHSREHGSHHAVDGIEDAGREVVGSSASLGPAKAAMLRLDGAVGSAQQLSFLANVAAFLLVT
jgi:hypothetical protein